MRKSFVTLLSLVLFLGVILSVGCGGGGGGGGSSPVAIVSDGSLADLKGQVTYQGNAVPNATVCLIKATGEEPELSRRASILSQSEPDFSILTADGNGYRTTSDAKGYYSFTQVPVGTYTVQALISNSIQVSRSVVLGAISDLDLALKPTGSISGKIVMNGSPVQAMVFLQGTSYIGITDLTGSFKILNVPVEATPYTLIPVVPYSYMPSSIRSPIQGNVVSGSAPASGIKASVPYGTYAFKNSPVQVTPVAGTNTDLGDLELITARGTIEGVARLPGATDHSGISVSASGGSTSTDADGKYVIHNIYFGQQTITFSKYYNSENYGTSTTVLVDSIATKTVSTVTLEPESATSAKVDVGLAGLTGTYGDGYVYYYLYNQEDTVNYEEYGSSYSEATSTYTLDPGTYYVRIVPGYNYTLLNPAAGSTDLLASITVAAGGNASFVARLQYNKATLSGTVSNIHANFPVSNAYLYPSGTSAYLSGGSYSFTGITPGVHSLVISAPGYQVSSTAVTLAAGANTKNVALTQIFPTVSGVSYSNPTVTVTGTRFVVSTASVYIAPLYGSSYPYTPATRTATQMTYDVSGFDPGAYTVTARGYDYAVATLSVNVYKQFTLYPAVSQGEVGTDHFTMNWSSIAGATGYNVYQDGNLITSTTDLTYTFTGLTPNTTYAFHVEATGNGINPIAAPPFNVTTYRVFDEPVVYDSGRSIGTPVKSFMYNGYLYAIGDNGSSYILIRYDMNNPDAMADTPAVLTPPSAGASITDLCVNSTGVYIGWKALSPSTMVYIERYNTDILGGVLNTYSASFTSAPQGIKVKGNNDTGVPGAVLQAFSWDISGVASLTYLTDALVPVATSSKTVPTDTSAIEWTSFTGSDGSSNIAMAVDSYSSNYCAVFDPSLSTIITSADTTPRDLIASPKLNGGFAWAGSNGVRYMNPPNYFGTGIIDNGSQVALDASDQIYTISENTDTLMRYNSNGNPAGSISFPAGYLTYLGTRLIHYDSAKDQIVVLTKAGTGGTNLGVMIFGTMD